MVDLPLLFYQTYCFFGKELLDQEKCGDSIKVLQHSQACKPQQFTWRLLDLYLPAVCEKATKLCERYARTKGPGTIARPERHPFFQKLAPMVKLHLDKSTRENGFM